MKVVFPSYPVAQGQLCAFKLAKQVAHLVGGNVIAGEYQGLNGPGRQRVIATVVAEVPKADEQQASQRAAGHDLLARPELRFDSADTGHHWASRLY
ncbi:hypothetical protein D3C80_1971230 [compost metagenome]